MAGKKYYTSEEILENSKEFGLLLTDRKLKYYVTVGILEKPLRNPVEASERLDGRVAYFSNDTLERLKKVRELQDSGFTLPQIKKYFERAIDPKLEDYLKIAGDNEAQKDISAAMLGKVFLSNEMREATLSFVRCASEGTTEESFKKTAINYYYEVLSLLIGDEKAEKYVKELILETSPENIEKKIEPLRKLRESILKKKTDGGKFLSKYLDEICEKLKKKEYKDTEILEKLRGLAERVQAMQDKYRQKAIVINEAFEMSKFMRQIFWIYLKALLEMENFIKDKKDEHLARASSLYNKADEMLGRIEELIAVIKNLVNLNEEAENL